MRRWKKVLVGGLAAATIGGGLAGTTAALGSPEGQAGRTSLAAGHRQNEANDDRGRREAEARGCIAELEREPGDDPNRREAEPADDRRPGEQASERGMERDDGHENQTEPGDDRNQGPSDRSGPSGHAGPGRDGYEGRGQEGRGHH